MSNGSSNGELFDRVVAAHPARDILRRLFPGEGRTSPLPSADPTGRTRRDYLPIIAGIVDFFRQHQSAAGAIIDPYEKRERQYATPAFALGTALLIAEAGREDLKDAAFRAFDFALEALAQGTTADGHADFYIPMLMHAHRLLLAHAAPSDTQRDLWTARFRALEPEHTYKDVSGHGNWNLVNVSGECLRRKDGLVAPDRRDAQAAYLERCLSVQQKTMTPFGMYADPNVPLAYDAFPRLWLEDVLAEQAYDGPQRAWLDDWLAKGSLSTLLLLSPSGEWACGGRSAFHQWNEAEVAVISEVNAVRWRRAGRSDIAGAFKRAAHLALGSVARWRRPSGELWIVKNRADPSLRHGYEGYSFHSQYNLLAGAMLAMAYQHADDSIPEAAAPSERGGYVFDLRDTFHKVCAAGGGVYVLLDTSGDSHYNASGLLRIHRAGIGAPLLSDNAAPQRVYGPRTETEKAALTTGLVGKTGDGVLQGIAQAHGDASLTVQKESPGQVAFTVGYTLNGAPDALRETYTLRDGAVTVHTHFAPGALAPVEPRVTLPLLVSDGATETHIAFDTASASVIYGGASLTWEIIAPPPAALPRLDGTRLATHNGYVQAAVADLPPGTTEATYRLRLQ